MATRAVEMTTGAGGTGPYPKEQKGFCFVCKREGKDGRWTGAGVYMCKECEEKEMGGFQIGYYCPKCGYRVPDPPNDGCPVCGYGNPEWGK